MVSPLGLVLVAVMQVVGADAISDPAPAGTVEGRPAPEDASPLQRLVDAAEPGARLAVPAGVYAGDLYLDKPYKKQGKADNGWEISGLKTAVHVRGTINDPSDRDQGWTLEIAFPWSAFNRGPRPALMPKPGETWRMNFSRVEWLVDVREGRYEKVPGKKEDNWVWSPQGLIDMHVPEMWGFVTFLR